MSSVNKVILIGNLGKDPEVRDAKGVAIANLTLATNKTWKTSDGEQKSKTEWHRLTCFKKTAELAEKYLHKGSKIYVEGELQTRSYEKDGVTKYSTEVLVNNIQFLDSKDMDDTGESAKNSFDLPDASHDEIPF